MFQSAHNINLSPLQSTWEAQSKPYLDNGFKLSVDTRSCTGSKLRIKHQIIVVED